jgi:hypothetical protein
MGSWKANGALALLTLLTFAERGYSFGRVDHLFYLPFIQKWSDPALFPHDFVVGGGLARSSPTWTLLGAMARFVDIQVLCLLLYALVTFLCLYYIYRTALFLWGDAPSAWLAVILWTPVHRIPETGFSGYLTARLIGTLIGLALLNYFLRKDLLKWAGALAAGVVLYLLMVVPLGGGIAAWAVWKRRWRDLFGLLAAAAMGSLALFAFWWKTGYPMAGEVVYSGDWYDLLRHVMPELFPAAWNLDVWLRLFLYAAGFFIVWTWALERRASREAGTVLYLGGALVVLGSAGAVVAAFWPLTTLVQLSLHRGFLYVAGLFLTGLGGLVTRVVDPEGGAGRRKPQPLLWIAGVSCLACWIANDVKMQVVGLVLLAALAWAPSLSTRMEGVVSRWNPGERAIACLGLLGLGLLVADRMDLSLVSLQRVCLIVAAGLIALATRELWGAMSRPFALHVGLATALLALAVLSPADNALWWLVRFPELRAYYHWTAPDRTRAAVGHGVRESEFREVEELVRSEVPKDAVVIVRPDWDDFRWRTRRSAFVTWKDRSVTLRSRQLAQAWRDRIKEIRGFEADSYTGNSQLALTPEEVVEISRRHAGEHVDYVVTSARYPFPLVGRRGRYFLYRIPGPEAPGEAGGPVPLGDRSE